MNGYAIRKFKDRLFFVLGLLCIVIAVLPLASILIEVIARGLPEMTLNFLTTEPGFTGEVSGGIGPAIQGSLILIGLTSLIGIPLGVMSGIYLAEYGTNRFAQTMRMFNDVLTEFPSIVVGLTIFLILVVPITRFSPLAGAIALAFIMIPIVARTTEEAIKLVPNSLREASLALGVRRWRTTVSVVVTAAKAGLLTGILLALSRIAGETAPLIMTVLGNNHFFQGLYAPVAALPLFIWRYAALPSQIDQSKAWGAALVLILIVLSLNVVVRIASSGRQGLVRRRV
jgi:phosphate transport system permease protein